MTTINICDFIDYDSKAVYEFLFLQGETEFEITILRESVGGKDDNYSIAIEYINASYAGQRLAQIADVFAYFVPSEFTKKPFLFEITITDMEKFADNLYFIIQGFDFRDTKETFITFQGLAAEFLNDSYDDKIKCQTWGILDIGSQYLED
jgi:hypothetical protein